MKQFDTTLLKSLDEFMESYKMVDVEQIYSNGTEFVPIFRVKQWCEYNNINKLQSNWNSLREWLMRLKNSYMETDNIFDDAKFRILLNVLDKMNELEGKDNNGK